MLVRGAPLIGVTAAFGMYLGIKTYKGEDFPSYLNKIAEYLTSARPTAVNLEFAVNLVHNACYEIPQNEALDVALKLASQLKDDEINFSSLIGDSGLKLIEDIYNRKKGVVNILTHCNAGWLACIDWGTATAPIYKAHQKEYPYMFGSMKPDQETREPGSLHANWAKKAFRIPLLPTTPEGT